jgi:hypothetical protein
MGGILQVDTIQNNNATTLITQTNSTTLTFGVSGQNIVIPSGVTFNTASATINYPAGSITNADIASTAAISTSKLGAGAVLQVVNVNYSTLAVSSTSAFADTGLSASITPSSASNKILVLTNVNGVSKQNSNTAVTLRLVRGVTDILNIEGIAAYNNASTYNAVGSCSTSYLDSPNTTSATTYKVTFRSFNNSVEVFINNYDAVGNSNSTMTLLEIKG